MRLFFLFSFMMIFLPFRAQQKFSFSDENIFYSPEVFFGWTNKANEDFPKTRIKKQIGFTVSKTHQENPQEWAQRLTGLRTGISFVFSDFGNKSDLGFGLTFMPVLEFPILKSEHVFFQTGLGISYHTSKFHPQKNPNNEAISTSLTWAYKAYFYYSFPNSNSVNWRVGGGYAHHSNGHTRLRNQGLNSFLIGISADIKPGQPEKINLEPDFPFSEYSYFSLRSGLGRNVLATSFNDRKNVYAFSAEYGKVFNNTWKIGAGFYYHFYEHYYQYIKNNYSLVQPYQEFHHFHKNPKRFASNLGFHLHGELLLNHIGIVTGLGYDIYKPAYKLDWRLNAGWKDTPVEIPDTWVLGEYSTYFKLKYRISARLGLKYYVFKTHVYQPHNLFVGVFINSNLGQADFTEAGVGYVYNFKS